MNDSEVSTDIIDWIALGSKNKETKTKNSETFWDELAAAGTTNGVQEGRFPEETLWNKLWNPGQTQKSPDSLVPAVYDPDQITETTDISKISQIEPGVYSIYVEGGSLTLLPIVFDPNLKDRPLGDGSISELKKYAPPNCYGIARVGTDLQKVKVELFKDIPELPEMKQKYAG